MIDIRMDFESYYNADSKRKIELINYGKRIAFMGYIADEIHRAITDNHLESHLLPLSYVEDLRTSIIKQYCTKDTILMWECFKDCVSYQDSNAWSRICNYVKDNECIMFFNKSDDKNAFCELKEGVICTQL